MPLRREADAATKSEIVRLMRAGHGLYDVFNDLGRQGRRVSYGVIKQIRDEAGIRALGPGGRRSTKTAEKTAAMAKGRGGVEGVKLEPLPAWRLPVTDPGPGPNAKAPAELTWHDCRYPYNDPKQPDFCFCGERVENPALTSYCEEHARRCCMQGNGGWR